jgi:hypothetical protein
MFYVLIFSILAVVLVVAGVGAWSRRRRAYEYDEVVHSTHATHSTHDDASRRTRKAKRAQSRSDRRKR